jgi:hypothetical protein
MALPTDSGIELLLCDSVRPTPEGKLDIIGFFPLPEILLDPSTPLPASMDLTFLYIIRDGEGPLGGAFRIIDPLGGEVHRHEIPEFNKLSAGPHLLMYPIMRIPIKRSGSFTAVLELAGAEYRRSIKISQ